MTGSNSGVTNNGQTSFEQYESSTAEADNERKLEDYALDLLNLSLQPGDKSTAVVWDHIECTQSNYGGTTIPKSFNIDTPSGKMWAHGNATEHIYETMISIKATPALKNSNPRLYEQFILYDYYKSLGNAVKNGIVYNKKIIEGNWEFIFAKPRENSKYPVIKHSKFSGLSK